MDGIENIFIIALFIIVIGVILFIGLLVADAIWGYELEEVSFECTIAHMDVDSGKCIVTVVGNNFYKTIKVTWEEYADHSVGDKCIVVRKGWHYPSRGNIFSYSIVEK